MRRAVLIALTSVVSLVAPAYAKAPAFDLRLIEPAALTTVRPGATAFVAWEAEGIAANVDEWEAYVSLDGGRTYPLRVTPHLDLSVHCFAWTVPTIPGAKITMLLRFGDERDESRFVFRDRLRVGDGSVSAPPAALPLAAAAEHGQSADLDEEGAVAWVEGDRRGTDLRQVVRIDAAAVSPRPSIQLAAERDSASIVQTRERGDPLFAGVMLGAAAPGVPATPRAQICSRAKATNILLTSRRRNI